MESGQRHGAPRPDLLGARLIGSNPENPLRHEGSGNRGLRVDVDFGRASTGLVEEAGRQIVAFLSFSFSQPFKELKIPQLPYLHVKRPSR